MITALLSFFTWNRIKTFLIIFLVVAAVWFFQSWQYRGEEMKRQADNMQQVRQLDSFKYASLSYKKDEIDEMLNLQRQDLKEFLDDNRIKTKRIERIITQKLEYLDTQSREVDLNPILDAIKENKEARIAVKDSTECLIIEGWVVYKNDSLKLDITNREFKNITDVVAYWERNKWRTPFGFSTRLFGKKKATVIVKDKCGLSRTIVIDKKD